MAKRRRQFDEYRAPAEQIGGRCWHLFHEVRGRWRRIGEAHSPPGRFSPADLVEVEVLSSWVLTK